MNRIARYPGSLCVLWLMVAWLGGAQDRAAWLRADVLDPSQAERISQRELSRVRRFPWFDATTSQPAEIHVPDPEPLRGSPSWVAKQKKKANRAPTDWSWIDGFVEMFGYLMWLLLAVVLGILIYFWLSSAALRRLATQAKETAATVQGADESELIERLPFQVKRPQTDLLGEARRHYEQGNYREAIIYLFSYQLVQLDRKHLIQLTKGKTNRQYLAELRRVIPLRDLVGRTMLVFEDVFFGHYDLQRERFESIWRELPTFEQLTQSEPT